MPKLLIYTIGDREHGMGHVLRCLTLAEALRARGVEVTFATTPHTPGLTRLRQAGANVYDFSDGDLAWCYRFPDRRAAVIDVENGPEEETLIMMRRNFDTVITVNGSGYTLHHLHDVRIYSDLLVYQSLVAMPDKFVKTLAGVEYVLVHPDYAACTPRFDGPIVVSLGGSDPHGLTGQLVEALIGCGRDVVFIIGPAQDTSKIRWLQGQDLSMGRAVELGAVGEDAGQQLTSVGTLPNNVVVNEEDHVLQDEPPLERTEPPDLLLYFFCGPGAVTSTKVVRHGAEVAPMGAAPACLHTVERQISLPVIEGPVRAAKPRQLRERLVPVPALHPPLPEVRKQARPEAFRFANDHGVTMGQRLLRHHADVDASHDHWHAAGTEHVGYLVCPVDRWGHAGDPHKVRRAREINRLHLLVEDGHGPVWRCRPCDPKQAQCRHPEVEIGPQQAPGGQRRDEKEVHTTSRSTLSPLMSFR